MARQRAVIISRLVIALLGLLVKLLVRLIPHPLACFFFGPMVNYFIESFYDLENLSSNMDFAVIFMYSTFYYSCQSFFTVVKKIIFPLLEKRR